MALLHNFDDWNIKKKALHSSQPDILFKEGQIWWCSVGVNIGEEVLGKGKMYRRPVIVFKKISGTACICIPTTTQERVGSWYFPFTTRGLKRYAMLHQIKFMSVRRFSSRESSMSEKDFLRLKKTIKGFYGL